MLKLDKLPNGEYALAAPQIANDLLELVMAAINLLEAHDQSVQDLLFALEDGNTTRTQMLSAVISELENLLNSGLLEFPFDGLQCSKIVSCPFPQ